MVLISLDLGGISFFALALAGSSEMKIAKNDRVVFWERSGNSRRALGGGFEGGSEICKFCRGHFGSGFASDTPALSTTRAADYY